MIIKYLLILGIGHTAGDFYLQSQKMAEEKDKSFRGVVMHSLEYALVMAAAVIPVFDWNLLLGALGLSFSHFLIDAAKYLLLKKGKAKKSAGLFVYDQMAHIACIFAAAYFLYNAAVPAAVIPPIAHVLETFEVSKMALARWILALMLVHMPANILIQQVLKENRGSLQAESEFAEHPVSGEDEVSGSGRRDEVFPVTDIVEDGHIERRGEPRRLDGPVRPMAHVDHGQHGDAGYDGALDAHLLGQQLVTL